MGNSIELPEPFSFIFKWFAALPCILWLALSITNFFVKDFLILRGPCPNCGTENFSSFGTILPISNVATTAAACLHLYCGCRLLPSLVDTT
ncbi:hypothetical protein LOK49_LG06G02402 [Camellia lanceoleosa]|uniref:Uncharacterized protein n=1 Tax=Camellia lanceoleosa TaxID=1840588 RepID=A0ACC0HEW7_9ERIC|nr:hypothetical protein LOK49_LG06G02402 [Camellia lanceoleosa]